MTLTELRYIVTLAREKHFRKAAEKCFVSQPTLSVAIKKLEDELKVAIFERSRTEVRVTPLGERIVEQAVRVLEEAERIRTLADEGQGEIHTPLRIGAIFTIGPYLFPHLIRHIKPIAPDMPLVLEENYTEPLRQKLRNGELDTIIISLPFREPETDIMELFDDFFTVLIPASHPLAAKDKITRKQMEKENMLLLGRGHCFRDQVLKACPAMNTHLPENQRLPEGTSLETLRHMVASGLGLTVVPMSAVDHRVYDSDTLVYRPFAGKQPYRTVAMVWRSRFSRPKAIEAVRQAIQSCSVDIVRQERA
ncbi:MAG: LysR substrate-binding domain-containing protein [Ketobacteraceae bacterium]|nr:LysR substrate-binding domain-containing protein [Ketobacteraceae bacterium]